MMAAIPDDPTRAFPDPAAAALLAALAAGAAPAREGPGPWTPGGWVLRTHPDLEEFAEKAFRPARRPRHAYGFAVFTGRGGRIVAVARSQKHLSLRLPPEAAPAARAAGGEEDPALGPGWWTFDAWRAGPGLPDLAELAARASYDGVG
jgi:hypothetical protein